VIFEILKNIFFAGRLAESKYYDIDTTCRSEIDIVEKETLKLDTRRLSLQTIRFKNGD